MIRGCGDGPRGAGGWEGLGGATLGGPFPSPPFPSSATAVTILAPTPTPILQPREPAQQEQEGRICRGRRRRRLGVVLGGD